MTEDRGLGARGDEEARTVTFACDSAAGSRSIASRSIAPPQTFSLERTLTVSLPYFSSVRSAPVK